MNSKTLLDDANQAFNHGDNTMGLKLLRRHNSSPSATASSYHQQAVVEEQIGDINLAGRAHYQCIQAAPQIAMSYVYGAYWLELRGEKNAAAALYSLAQEADPSSLISKAQHSPANKLRADAGDRLLRRFLSEQHRELFRNQPELDRIKNSIWTRTHDSVFEFDDARFAPEIFWIPHLSCKPFYSTEEFPWANQILTQRNGIIQELCSALDVQNRNKIDIDPAKTADLRPYLPANSIAEGELKELAGSMQWSALDLYRNGELNEEVADAFKLTLSVIDSIDCYSLEQAPFEVFFSLLKPRQSIAPHHGQSNHALTVHLPLIIPNDCHLQVGEEIRQWREDQLMIFDDSFIHSAHNNSEQMRIVLIFSIWHPDLTISERQAIQSTFRTRQAWMQKRVNEISSLIDD